MTLVYIVLLLLANGFFVAAEFALVKIPAIRVDAMAASGSAMARLTKSIHDNLEAYLAACQLGITMASLGLGWIGEPAVAALLEPLFSAWGMSDKTLHTVSFLVGFVLFSSLHIVIGEQVPKTYAIRRADAVSLWVALPLLAFYWLAFPLNWILNRASGAVLKMLGVQEVSHVEVLSGGEIRELINVSSTHGEIERDQAAMLKKVFLFDERPVSSVMLPRSEIDRVSVEASIPDLLAEARETRHSRYPVIEDDWSNVRGILLVKDLLLEVDTASTGKLSDFADLLRPAQLVPETQPIKMLFEQMRGSRDHIALAIDEYGQVAGLVTLEDLVEEIVGEIADETDRVEQPFGIETVDGGWQAHGLASLADLERITGIELDDHGANTIAGLIMVILHRIPEVGDSAETPGMTLRVLEMNGSRIERVELSPRAHPAVDPGAGARRDPDPQGGDSGNETPPGDASQ